MPSLIKSLSKGLKVYRFIADYGKPILAVTLCEKLQIDKSTMSRLLKTLKDEDFISYLENSNEIIANDISNKTNQSTKIELLIKKTKVLLEEISKTTNECAYLGIFDDYKVSYINQIDLSNQELKTRNMSLLRERKLGYIVPGYFCFIPEMLLHHSVQRIKSAPLSIFATTIVMQYLESQLTTQFFANDLILFGSKMSKSRAISELEERKIIEISKYGRTNRITFLKSKLELWSARKSLLSPICTKIITVKKDLIDFSLDHTFCGETALSVYTLLTPPKRKCIAMDKWIYDDEFYKSEIHHVNDSQLIDIYIYPMNFKTDRIRENRYISPIALILSGLKPSDERAFSSYKELEDMITDRLKIKSHDFK